MKRSTRRKKIFMFAVGLSSLLVLASDYIELSQPIASEPRYTVQDLGVGIYPSKINGSGTVVGIISGNKSLTQAFVWQEQAGRDSLALDSESLSFANDISETGLVVGHIGDEDGYSRAYSWMSRNTEFNFTPFDQGHSVAYAVNSYGHMAGQIGEGAKSNYEAFHYEPSEGIRYLGTLGGNLSQATGLNDSGEVVGWSVTENRATHAFRWSEEIGMVDIGTLGGGRSFASAINTSGKIVGQSEAENGQTQAALFENGEVKNLGSFGGGWSLASDINEHGVVVGQAEAPQTLLPPFAQRVFDIGSRFIRSKIPKENAFAVIFEHGEPDNLNLLVPREAGWDSLTAATGVNDHGQIVGFGKKNGHLHGFLLTPVGYEESDDTLILSLNKEFLSAN